MAETQDNWRTYFGEHGAALVLFARQFCPTLEDAEDAVQDGFARFWPRRTRARDAQAYLYSCVRSAAMDLSRSARRRNRREQAAGPPSFFQADPLEDRQGRERIERAMADLPLAQREVLVLKIWGGLSFAQIAQTDGISINTAASRYRYALAALRKQLSDEDQR